MLETTFFYAAAIGGAFLVLQLIMIFVGGIESNFDIDTDLGPDHGGGDIGGYWFFEMVSLKTLAAAATFFGLTGLTALAYDATPTVSLLLGCVAGFVAMYCVYWLFKQLFKLQSSGTQLIQNALGLPGQVYIPIPPTGSGVGKVHITMQNRTVEYQAVSDDADRLATGAAIVVVDIVNEDTVRVARAS